MSGSSSSAAGVLHRARRVGVRAHEQLGLPGRLGRPFPSAPAGSGLRTVPGDSGPPLVGYSLPFMRDPLKWGRMRYERYGPVSWSNVFGTRMVGLIGPDACETALANRDKAFANGPGWGYFIGPFFHRGIMLLDFEEHLHHRRIMQGAFTNDRLCGYLGAMNPAIERGIGTWRTGDGFLVLPAMKQLTLDLATRIFIGGRLGSEADQVNKAFVDTVGAGLSLLRFPVPGGRWAKGLAGRRLLEDFFAARLPAKRAGDGDDLFTALCHAESEDGHRFTDEDVINHMIFLLMAAHDTSTITMNTMIYYLAKHPGWQERVRDESYALGKEFVEYDDLEKLVSLDLVMREALRLVAPVPGLARRTVKDTEVCGYYLPEGTRVTVGTHVTHHLEEYWPDPEGFDPARFADDRREDKVHRYAWEPFGGGVHKCIGMYFAGIQIKAVLHQVLRRYRWSVPPDYETEFDFRTLPIPKDRLPVSLEPIR